MRCYWSAEESFSRNVPFGDKTRVVVAVANGQYLSIYSVATTRSRGRRTISAAPTTSWSLPGGQGREGGRVRGEGGVAPMHRWVRDSRKQMVPRRSHNGGSHNGSCKETHLRI